MNNLLFVTKQYSHRIIYLDYFNTFSKVLFELNYFLLGTLTCLFFPFLGYLKLLIQVCTHDCSAAALEQNLPILCACTLCPNNVYVELLQRFTV